jgi:hypothetical protein
MMPIRWKVRAIGLLVLVAIARGDLVAQSTSVPTMTLLVDETQAFRWIAFVHEQIRVQQDPLHSRIRAGFQANTDRLALLKILPRSGCVPERSRFTGRATLKT